MRLPTKIKAGGSQRWALPAVVFGRGWGTQTNCIQRCVIPDEGSDTGGHRWKRDQWAPTLCRRGHLCCLGWQGDAAGCFCPPRKLLNQVGPSSWCRGKKQALERNSLCPFKAMQRLGLERSSWKGGIWHAGLRSGGKPSLQGVQKRDFPAAAITPQTQLLGSLEPAQPPLQPLLPARSAAPSVCPGLRPLCPSKSRELRLGWSGASASVQPCQHVSPDPHPACPACCYNHVEINFPFLLPDQILLHREELDFPIYWKVQRSRCACEQRVCSASSSLIPPCDVYTAPSPVVFSIHLLDCLPGRAVPLAEPLGGELETQRRGFSCPR